MTLCSGCPGGWCAGCIPIQDETLKQYHVQMWEDFLDILPSEDEWVDAHTHVQALEIACHRTRLSYADWVQVDEQDGQTRKFLDASVSFSGSLEYDVFPS